MSNEMTDFPALLDVLIGTVHNQRNIYDKSATPKARAAVEAYVAGLQRCIDNTMAVERSGMVHCKARQRRHPGGRVMDSKVLFDGIQRCLRDYDAMVDDLAEKAFWEFDAERKRTGAMRDAFKRQFRIAHQLGCELGESTLPPPTTTDEGR